MNYSEFKTKYRLTLNSQQDEVVQSIEGATLLLAVPGSGKTTVLVSRLGYMVHALGIDPESILTMTYTVAATNDMRKRFIDYFGTGYAESLEFRTINGVCSKIIMSYERSYSKKAFELITDEKQISAVISQIFRSIQNDFATESDIKNIRSLITYAKNMMLSKDEIKELESGDLEFQLIYNAYNEYLRENKLMDYDDQMVYAYQILRKFPELLKVNKEKYKYICVDEAQDTSKIQHAIISLLAGRKGNLFMVGDEDQSIYGFRAAYPEALLSFKDTYDNARILLMEENFRSDANIVSMAQRFISSNKYRHKKHMKAVKEKGKSVRKIALTSREAQYSYLLKALSNTDKQTAVLYRDNESALPLIDIFERNGISYNAKAFDQSFFSHRVVRDIIDIINFALNPYDKELFLKVYYKLSTYLTKEAAFEACEISEKKAIPITHAFFEMPRLTGGTKKACSAISTHITNLAGDMPGNVIYRIAKRMGYNDYLDRMGVKTSKILILENIASRVNTAAQFLQRLDELASIISERRYDKNSNILLSTIHSSKGLEYESVYIIDVVDCFFPEITVKDYKNAIKEDIKLYEEERRLFYVAVTRAKNELAVFSYKGEPSCFCDQFFGIQEVKEEVIDSFDPLYMPFLAEFKRGRIICHKHFGVGSVKEVAGDIITVKFNIGIEKKLSVKVLYEQGLCSIE